MRAATGELQRLVNLFGRRSIADELQDASSGIPYESPQKCATRQVSQRSLHAPILQQDTPATMAPQEFLSRLGLRSLRSG